MKRMIALQETAQFVWGERKRLAGRTDRQIDRQTNRKRERQTVVQTSTAKHPLVNDGTLGLGIRYLVLNSLFSWSGFKILAKIMLGLETTMNREAQELQDPHCQESEPERWGPKSGLAGHAPIPGVIE